MSFAETPTTHGFEPCEVSSFGAGMLTPLYTLTNTHGVAPGDFVAVDGAGGLVTLAAGSFDNSSANLAGIVAQIYDVSGNLLSYWHSNRTINGRGFKSGTNCKIALFNPFVVTDYFVIEDNDTTPIAAANIGRNIAGMAVAHSTTTGYSQAKIDSNTINTTITLPFKVLEQDPRDGNTVGTGPCTWRVRINLTALGSYGTTGI